MFLQCTSIKCHWLVTYDILLLLIIKICKYNNNTYLINVLIKKYKSNNYIYCSHNNNINNNIKIYSNKVKIALPTLTMTLKYTSIMSEKMK